jgi:hypothetical protein
MLDLVTLKMFQMVAIRQSFTRHACCGLRSGRSSEGVPRGSICIVGLAPARASPGALARFGFGPRWTRLADCSCACEQCCECCLRPVVGVR